METGLASLTDFSTLGKAEDEYAGGACHWTAIKFRSVGEPKVNQNVIKSVEAISWVRLRLSCYCKKMSKVPALL